MDIKITAPVEIISNGAAEIFIDVEVEAKMQALALFLEKHMFAQDRVILFQLHPIRIVAFVLESMINVRAFRAAHFYMNPNIFFLLGHL
jgi:hypothetical protein